MFDTDLARRFAAVLCTLVMSTTCIVATVGPAHADTQKTPAPIVLTA